MRGQGLKRHTAVIHYKKQAPHLKRASARGLRTGHAMFTRGLKRITRVRLRKGTGVRAARKLAVAARRHRGQVTARRRNMHRRSLVRSLRRKGMRRTTIHRHRRKGYHHRKGLHHKKGYHHRKGLHRRHHRMRKGLHRRFFGRKYHGRHYHGRRTLHPRRASTHRTHVTRRRHH